MKMNLRSVDLNLLPVFDAIMETGQLSQAGEKLGMSQPAVSAALQRLRDTLGDELFVRTRYGMSPTPRASEIYATTSQALEMLRSEFEQSRAFEPANCARHFTIMGGDYVELLHHGPLVALLAREAPGITTEITPLMPGDYARPLLNGEIDVAVHYAIPADRGLESTRVLEDRLAVVCRSDHPRAATRLTTATFCAEQHVTLLPTPSGTGHFESFMGNNRVERRPGARVTQFSAMIPVILHTDQLCIMPHALASFFAARESLVVHELPIPAPPLAVYLVWARRYHRDPAHHWLREQLRAVMAG
ncbi:LysR family transcriptional regulator [Haliea sp. E17]|uniref:LysR family transcriptional regulator n=1 Tax=Haliea sp. E17 TaxID=3401576 RepID=UPI003AAB4F02